MLTGPLLPILQLVRNAVRLDRANQFGSRKSHVSACPVAEAGDGGDHSLPYTLVSVEPDKGEIQGGARLVDVYVRDSHNGCSSLDVSGMCALTEKRACV